MRDLEARLERLQRAVEGRTGPQTIFTCADGSTWSTTEDTLSFLRLHGTQTPSGRKIVGWRRPEGPMDELSASLCALIDEVIAGSVPWSEV